MSSRVRKHLTTVTGTFLALGEMTVRFLPRGAKVADAAFPNASFPAQLAAEGYEAFCGYLSSPTSNGKNWSAQRLAWFVDFPGVGHGMFCEQFETIVLQGYSAANLSLGRQCQDMADSFGVPDDVPMWFAVDTSPFGHFPEIAESFRAYKDTNRRPLGGYVGSQCGEYLMDLGLIDYLHVPSALSWSATSEPYDGVTVFTYNNGKNRWYLSPRAHMLQHNSVDFAGSRIDPSDVLQPTPFWFPSETTDPIEPVEVETVQYTLFQLTDSDACFGGYWDRDIAQEVVWLDNPTFLHYRDDLHKPVRPTGLAELKGCYLLGPLPQADGRHTWTGAEFKWAMSAGLQGPPGIAGPPGPQGPPGATPHGTFPATLTL